MFDFSFGEVGIIAVVALLVLGPERLPKVARTSGALLRKARRSWQNVREEIEREFAAEELKRSLKDSLQAADPRSVLDDTVKDIHAAMPQQPVISPVTPEPVTPEPVTPSAAIETLGEPAPVMRAIPPVAAPVPLVAAVAAPAAAPAGLPPQLAAPASTAHPPHDAAIHDEHY